MNKLPTEQQEAEILASYLRLRNIPFTHIPNETGGDMLAKRRAIRMKRAGVSKGFPDYLIIYKGKLVFIELKRRKGGRVSLEQKEWLEVLNNVDNSVARVCNGADDAIGFLEGIEDETRR